MSLIQAGKDILTAPTIEYLSEYLRYRGSDGEDIYQTPPWKCDKFPWNGPTCLAVVSYVIKLNNNILDQTINHLNYLAHNYVITIQLKLREANNHWSRMPWAFLIPDFNSCRLQMPELFKLPDLDEELQRIREEISNEFVNSFIPKVQKFFEVPNLQEVPHNDNSLKENEMLACFMDFLLQILNSEALISSNKEKQYTFLQKELTVLLGLLGDIPFQCTELEEVNNILREIETFANEAGSFIYSSVFSPHPIMANKFIEGRYALLEIVELLNIKIKEHCIKFSELPSRVISGTCSSIDSIFIVDSLIEDVENLMDNQVDLFIKDEMKVQIGTLHEELILSRSFLKGIDRLQDTSDMDELNESFVQFKNVAYEAKYLVNSYVVGNLSIWYLNLRLPVVIQKIKVTGVELQHMKKICDIKISNIKNDFSEEVTNHPKGTPTTMSDDILVGFEDERTNILNDLVGGSKNRQIISIFGMPGIGKTIIANKMYKDSSITDHFDERGWCVVSQTYRKRKVLIDILMSLSKIKIDKNNIMNMEDTLLSLMIHKSLKGRRYLIVIDDVWTTNLWDDLRRFFPDDENGSRIMLTSRIRDTMPTDSIFHELPFLLEDQCWNLLEKKVFSQEPCPPQLQGIGKRIAIKCGGLPLTVIVVAGILANLEKEESVWEKVETNLDSYIFDDDANDYSKILELSFKHLPDHLKMCFLYFGAFPEDTIIPVWKLTWMWIAEGFIQRQQDMSLEQVAKEYFFDLISRSLVLIGEKGYDGEIKTCKIHDLLRDMCLRIAREENFSKLVKEYSGFPVYEKSHRLFVQTRSTAGVIPFGLHYHSFLGQLSHPSSKFPQMKLLRVMDIWSKSGGLYEFQRIDLLVQLRYLAIDRMPKPLVGNFINLEFLIIDSKETIFIPSVILKLVKLRHLHIKKDAEFEEDCHSCQTTNLRSLSYVRINDNYWDEEILKCSPHLRELKCIYIHGTQLSDLRSLNDLEILDMKFNSCFTGELRNIYFPSTIKKLSLSNLRLPCEEISIIGRLPNLHVLKLSMFGANDIWETRDDEFKELRFLQLSFEDVMEWITCREHFPQLQYLILAECYSLNEIPGEIGDITTLKTIELINCAYKLCISAIQIEEEQRDQYGNEDLHVIITSYQWSKEQLVRKLHQLV